MAQFQDAKPKMPRAMKFDGKEDTIKALEKEGFIVTKGEGDTFTMKQGEASDSAPIELDTIIVMMPDGNVFGVDQQSFEQRYEPLAGSKPVEKKPA